jgi:hypothetical protein
MKVVLYHTAEGDTCNIVNSYRNLIHDNQPFKNRYPKVTFGLELVEGSGFFEFNIFHLGKIKTIHGTRMDILSKYLETIYPE